MPTPALTDAQITEAVAASKAHPTKRAAADALKLTEGAYYNRLRAAAARGLMGFAPVLPGMEITQTSTRHDKHGEFAGESIQTRREPGEVFEYPEGLVLDKLSVLTDGDRRTKLIWHKLKEDKATVNLIDAIKEEFETYRGYAKLVPAPRSFLKDIMVVYPIVDPHLGLLAWGPETGESNDLKIGVERIETGINNLIDRSPAAHTALLINTGDYFHADNQKNETERSGHQLDVDGRSKKVKLAGVHLMRTTIDRLLQKHKTIIVKNLKGNHDPESASWLNITLGIFYERNKRVVIDMDDGNDDHFWHLFGKNYIGATHGHTSKPERMAMEMADANPDWWAASDYRWMIFGHIHHFTGKSVGSVRVESFEQPVPGDAFKHAGMYGGRASMSAIVLHKEGGEESRQKINFPRPRIKAVA